MRLCLLAAQQQQWSVLKKLSCDISLVTGNLWNYSQLFYCVCFTGEVANERIYLCCVHFHPFQTNGIFHKTTFNKVISGNCGHKVNSDSNLVHLIFFYYKNRKIYKLSKQ